MSLVVMLGQDVKCLLCIARNMVDFVALSNVPRKYCASSLFVVSSLMIPFTACVALCCSGGRLGGVDIDMSVSGTFHSPLSVRLPRIRIFASFKKFTSYFLNMATQSSSHSCPMDNNDLLVNLGYTRASVALFDKFSTNGNEPLCVALMVALLGSIALGPSNSVCSCERYSYVHPSQNVSKHLNLPLK